MLVPRRGRRASMVVILQLGMLGLMWEILAACGEDCQMAFHDGNNACLQAALRAAMLTGRGRVNHAVRPLLGQGGIPGKFVSSFVTCQA